MLCKPFRKRVHVFYYSVESERSRDSRFAKRQPHVEIFVSAGLIVARGHDRARWDRENAIGKWIARLARTHARARSRERESERAHERASARARWWAVRSMKDALRGSRARLRYAQVSPRQAGSRPGSKSRIQPEISSVRRDATSRNFKRPREIGAERRARCIPRCTLAQMHASICEI